MASQIQFLKHSRLLSLFHASICLRIFRLLGLVCSICRNLIAELEFISKRECTGLVKPKEKELNELKKGLAVCNDFDDHEQVVELGSSRVASCANEAILHDSNQK